MINSYKLYVILSYYVSYYVFRILMEPSQAPGHFWSTNQSYSWRSQPKTLWTLEVVQWTVLRKWTWNKCHVQLQETLYSFMTKTAYVSHGKHKSLQQQWLLSFPTLAFKPDFSIRAANQRAASQNSSHSPTTRCRTKAAAPAPPSHASGFFNFVWQAWMIQW